MSILFIYEKFEPFYGQSKTTSKTRLFGICLKDLKWLKKTKARSYYFPLKKKLFTDIPAFVFNQKN